MLGPVATVMSKPILGTHSLQRGTDIWKGLVLAWEYKLSAMKHRGGRDDWFCPMEVGLDRNQMKEKGHSGKRTWHRANGALKLLCYGWSTGKHTGKNPGQEHIRDSALGQKLITDSAFCTITAQERKISPVYFIWQNYNSDFLFLLVCPKPADPTPTLRTVINRAQLFL